MNSLGKDRTPFFFLTDFGTERCLVERTDDLPANELQFVFPGHSHTSRQKPDEMPGKIEWETYPESFDTYKESFDTVRSNILAGNSFLTNLTCATPVRTNMSLEQICTDVIFLSVLCMVHEFLCQLVYLPHFSY